MRRVSFIELARLLAGVNPSGRDEYGSEVPDSTDVVYWLSHLAKACIKSDSFLIYPPFGAAPVKDDSPAISSLLLVGELRLADARRLVAAVEPGRVLPELEEGTPSASSQPTQSGEESGGAKRIGQLDHVIALANQKATNPTSWQSAWSAFVEIAASPDRPLPLIGYAEAEGVKYTEYSKDGSEKISFLSRELFAKRYKRRYDTKTTK